VGPKQNVFQKKKLKPPARYGDRDHAPSSECRAPRFPSIATPKPQLLYFALVCCKRLDADVLAHCVNALAGKTAFHQGRCIRMKLEDTPPSTKKKHAIGKHLLKKTTLC
jgi:hypothetical protein